MVLKRIFKWFYRQLKSRKRIYLFLTGNQGKAHKKAEQIYFSYKQWS